MGPDGLDDTRCRIDIKEDGFFSGPYRQERVLVFEIELPIEELEVTLLRPDCTKCMY
jgi:hypothetical protein